MTWEIATFEQDDETQFVSRENITEMDREQLVDYIRQLEAVIAQLKYDKVALEHLLGVR